MCAAVGARLVIRSRRGERVLDMHEFSVGPYETAVGPAEMLVEIRVPRRSGSAYAKVDRRVGDWAIAAVGAALDVERRRDHPRRHRAHRGRRWRDRARGGAALVGAPADPGSLQARGGSSPPQRCDPVTDQRGSKEYKRHVVGVLTERVLQRAAERAQSSREV